MFNTFSLLGFQCLDGLLIPEPLLLSAGQKLWLQKASFQSFSLISGYSFFNSLLLALFQALINLLSSILDCAWNITYTWSMSWFHSSRTIPYLGAICSHIPFALSEIGLSMTFSSISHYHDQMIVHHIYWMRIMIYFSFSTDSIIPWIALLNKCSLFIFTQFISHLQRKENSCYIMLKFLFCVVFCLFSNDISSSSSKVFTSLCKIYLTSQFLCVIYKSYKRVS